MSEKPPTSPPTTKRAPDPRPSRTRERLGDALVSLILEKPFADITVQDVLDRAQVSRSTFYEHYRDKDDLFVSDIEDFLDWLVAHVPASDVKSDRVLPVRELFAHVATMGVFVSALDGSGRLETFYELAQAYFARAIEQRFAVVPRAAALPAERRAPLAQALAGGLIALMRWWIASGRPGTPEEMDALFHRQVWGGVDGA
jgi:AcrR family transcriptional regulator